MALNANAPYTGAVQYLMQFTSPSTFTAPGVVVGGEYQVDAKLRTAHGLAGQKVTRGGVVTARVKVVLEEPLKTIMSGMLRSSPATTVTAKSFYFGNQDGEWTYTDCQPGGFVARCAVDESFRVEADFWAKTPGQSASGNTQGAVSGGIADNWSSFDVLVDGTDYACQRFELAVKTNPFVYSTLDSRTVGTKRLPVQVLLGTQEVELTLDCAKQLPIAASSLLADAVDSDIDLVIAGSGVTFTLTGLTTPVETGPFKDKSGLLAWRYKFTDTDWAALSVS